MAVPYTFAGATSSIPLSQLDANFATAFTLGNTAIQLGNTVTTLNNMTLANVTISSGNVTITNVSVTTANVTTGNVTTLTSTNATLTNMSSGNVTITGGTINGTTLGATTAASANVTTLTTSSTVTLNGGTANGVAYLNGSKVLTTGSALTFDGTNLGLGGTTNSYGSQTAFTLSGTNVSRIDFRSNGTFTGSLLSYQAVGEGLRLQTESSLPIVFSPGGTEAMRLTSTGLGIGTSSPTAKLHVNGDIRIADTSSLLMGIGAEQKIFVAGGASSTYLTFNQWTGSAYTERMRLDSSGNLGLGVTPSAWGIGKALQVNNASMMGYLNRLYANANTYFDGTGTGKYIATDYATSYQQLNGQHLWFTAPSGTAGNAISFTQAMTLDASGNLIGGGKTSASLTTVGFELTSDGSLRSTKSSTNTNLATNNGGCLQLANSSATDGNFSNIGAYNSNGLVVSQIDFINVSHASRTGDIAFLTHNGSSLLERARIPSAGGFVVGTAALATNATTGFLYVPTCAGTPTGTPATQTGTAPIVVDTTNNKLYFYSGGQWRDAGP